MTRVRRIVLSASVNPSRRSMSTRQPITLRPAVAIRTVRPRCSLRACQGAFNISRPCDRLASYQWSSRRIKPRATSERSTGAPPRSIWMDVAPAASSGGKRFVVEVNVQADPDDRAPAGSGARPGAPAVASRGAGTRSTKMPAILRPSIRTSLGHLIVASRPVQSVTTSATATAPSAVSHAQPKAASGKAGARWSGWKHQDRHQD